MQGILFAMPASSQVRRESTPVLIAGGGLVGLSTALFLAQHGVRALVVEKHRSTALHPRARGFNAATLELLAPSGVAAEAERLGKSFDPRVVGILTAHTLSGPVHRYEPFDDEQAGAQLSPRRSVAIGQDRLEPMILDAARARGADVRFGHELSSFTLHDDRVEALITCVATGERYAVEAPYLIAADGARSPIREALGVARTGAGSLGQAISTLFSADLSRFQDPHRFFLAIVTHPEVGGVIVGTDIEHRWIYGTSYDPSHESPSDFDEARWIARIRTATGDPSLALTVQGTFAWEPAERVAERLRIGRVFLAGDAAHQMPPSGAFGANTGIQDAGNLAWKLASVLSGEASDALLDSYDRERRPVARETARQALLRAPTRPSSRGPARDVPPGRGVPEVRDEAAERQARAASEKCDDAAVVFGYRYDDELTPIPRTCVPTGRPGTRAPHVWIARGDGRVSTRELFGRSWILLTACTAWADAARAVAHTLSVRIVPELANDFQRDYGIEHDGAVLVRPDGFVAARWPVRESRAESVLESALTTLLCRT